MMLRPTMHVKLVVFNHTPLLGMILDVPRFLMSWTHNDEFCLNNEGRGHLVLEVNMPPEYP